MATNFVTTGLAAFTNANPQKVLELAILDGTGTKDHYAYETGVKYQTKVPYVSNVGVDISTGSIAGYNTGSGTTTIVDVTLTNTQFKVFETYTKEQLNKTILGVLGKGTDPADLPLEEVIARLKSKELFNANEKMIWQSVDGSTTLTAGMRYFDGVLSQTYKVAGEYGWEAKALSGLADASVLYYVNKMNTQLESKLPQLVSSPMVLSMSPANFSAYSRAVYALNGTVTTQTVGADGKPIQEAYIPGTNVKAVAEPGLVGSNALLLTRPENIIVVYDLVGEDEIAEFIYNPYARQHELAINYKLGVKVVDPSVCIISTSAL